MNNMALKDSLTGIYNRRYINEKLPINLVNAALAAYSLTIIMADIDFFKNVNDNYGHLAGDYTLKYFAEILSNSLKRESDWVARYGGEEFIVCLPGVGVAYAAEIAENMRKTVENSEVDFKNLKFRITASFGISTLTPTINSSIEELIEEADKKLYKAKQNGRNRVEI
jgi:diguanylate cyclase (GGDEF)-like protein